ncbi:hypothetical protein ACFY2M_20660 [Streptomyces sp. NPDC001276]|uniref:hypothetical protein n=1 Tax=Streptomyces sp. NPDC001276 TaxID=3364555 RepID=UPI003686F06A
MSAGPLPGGVVDGGQAAFAVGAAQVVQVGTGTHGGELGAPAAADPDLTVADRSDQPQPRRTGAGPRGADLTTRAARVRAQLTELDTAAERARQMALPRITMLEDEYRRAVLTAELNWLDTVTSDLRTGTLTWDFETLAALAQDTS